MDIILWIVLGGLAGWLASVLVGSKRGLLGDILLGIIGALVGGWIVSLIGGRGVTGFNLSSLIVAIFGSTLVLWLSHALRAETDNA